MDATIVHSEAPITQASGSSQSANKQNTKRREIIGVCSVGRLVKGALSMHTTYTIASRTQCLLQKLITKA
jgi:hypothetical protein